mgnify:CR=1 FL=1
MKKKITIGILALGLVAMSFKMAIDKTGATVEQINGISVFAFSKPTAPYDIIGNVKVPGICSDRSDKRIDLLIERVKKDNPSANGLIINTEFGKAEAIRFKE